MRIVVTGGAGFIGSHLCAYLKERGYDVVAVDSLERASSYGLRLLQQYDIGLVQADVRDKARIRELVGNFDVMVHAAAYIDAYESIQVPEEYCDVNVTGTVAMLKLCVDVKAGRFIFLSSAAVYGEPQYVPIDENHSTRPVNPYGASKLAAEVFTETFYRAYKLEYIILRLFNVYGPGQSSAYAGLIAKTIERVSKNEPPIIYGTGDQTRDFVYVKDVVRAIELAINTENVCEVYNIGTGKEYRVKDVVETILRLMNRTDLKPIHAPPRPGDVQRSCADITKARKLLKYEPQYELEQGLRGTLLTIEHFTT